MRTHVPTILCIKCRPFSAINGVVDDWRTNRPLTYMAISWHQLGRHDSFWALQIHFYKYRWTLAWTVNAVNNNKKVIDPMSAVWWILLSIFVGYCKNWNLISFEKSLLLSAMPVHNNEHRACTRKSFFFFKYICCLDINCSQFYIASAWLSKVVYVNNLCHCSNSYRCHYTA